MKDFFYYWLPVFLYAGLIFYLSSLPTIPSSITQIISQTLILHMIEYAILGILLFRALTNSKNNTLKNNAILLSIMIATIYAMTDELHQYFVPGRICSFLDFSADFIGSLIGLVVCLAFYKKNIINLSKL
jgi:VanZ family protein